MLGSPGRRLGFRGVGPSKKRKGESKKRGPVINNRFQINIKTLADGFLSGAHLTPCVYNFALGVERVRKRERGVGPSENAKGC